MNIKSVAGIIFIVCCGVLVAYAGEAVPPQKPKEPEQQPQEKPATPQEQHRPSEPAQEPGQSNAELLQELKKVTAELKVLSESVTGIENNQLALDEKVAKLVSSSWEYQTASISGGASRDKLNQALSKKGREGFEYVGQTSEGLYIFKRRTDQAMPVSAPSGR